MHFGKENVCLGATDVPTRVSPREHLGSAALTTQG